MSQTVIKFRIPGNPQALKRHRTYRAGRFLRKVDPSAGDKADFLAIAMQNAPEKPLDGPLELRIRFTFSRPKLHFGTGKNTQKLKIDAPNMHAKKPDIDNLVKFVMDALNGVFWLDDAQICSIVAEKVYCPRAGSLSYVGPGVDVIISDAVEAERAAIMNSKSISFFNGNAG